MIVTKNHFRQMLWRIENPRFTMTYIEEKWFIK